MKEKIGLSPQQSLVLNSKMALRRKSYFATYLILLTPPLGAFGVHQWYLGNVARGITYNVSLLLAAAGLVLTFISPVPKLQTLGNIISISGFVVLALNAVLDSFTIILQVDKANRRIEQKIIRGLLEHIPTTPEQQNLS